MLAARTQFIDLFKKGCVVVEAKQGSEADTGRLGTAKRDTPAWNVAMDAAFGQAVEYASFLEERPPFILVTDIGYCFDVYASFGGTGYRHFPNALSHRFHLSQLAENAETLRRIFTDPLSLDPSKAAVDVTREVAERLAVLTKRLENAGHAPDVVADFLMRCIFTMFAEDVELLPKKLFTTALEDNWIGSPEAFPDGVRVLWDAMNDGKVFGFFGKLLHFNGGLFKEPIALPLEKKDLELLLDAAKCRWNEVEPAIFGALFEGALDKKERHKLGAHFTPREYVERLVRPTIEEPVREDWDKVRKKIRQLVNQNKLKKAKAETRAFLKELSEIRVLDPACGSGNFLYVALALLKSIEDEAFGLLLALENGQTELCRDAPEVTPKQFLGIEINPRAKAIAELVLWIGYLQWHFRTKHRGGSPREPIMQDYQNVENRDALIEYDSKEVAKDPKTGKPIERWDGVTMKRHPVTGRAVPDERFTFPVYDYLKPKRSVWPPADFIVGNPPFLGAQRLRASLGDGYVRAVWSQYTHIPQSADLVMYWWERAAGIAASGVLRRFGFITTNKISQPFNRRIVERYVGNEKPLSMVFAVPDHPWVEAKDGAAVRIAMSVSSIGAHHGTLVEFLGAKNGFGRKKESIGRINPDFTLGASAASLRELEGNAGIGHMGVKLHGKGFIVPGKRARDILERHPKLSEFLKPYVSGRALAQKPKDEFVVDFFGRTESEARSMAPQLMALVIDLVKPERDSNRRRTYKENWWIFGEPRRLLRPAIRGLHRYIVTVRTARHRVFQFLDADTIAESKLVVIASDDPYVLGVLSSRVHTLFAEYVGGWLGAGNDATYNHGDCFNRFPFPGIGSGDTVIRNLGEAIDAHRKVRLQDEPNVTMTGMYSVLEKLRVGQELSATDRAVHEQGLLSVLSKLHDDLDAAVLDAYGWPHDISDEEILERLVALNAERAQEEAGGNIRYLRPEFQAPKRSVLEETIDEAQVGETLRLPWPKEPEKQIDVVDDLLRKSSASLTANDVTAAFDGATLADVTSALHALVAKKVARVVNTKGERRWKRRVSA